MQVERVHSFFNVRQLGNNTNPIRPTAHPQYNVLPDLYIKSSPSFTAIRTHGQFRYLTHNHSIRCIYCKKPMIYPGDIIQLQNSGVFSGDIKAFLDKAYSYKKSLKPISLNVLSKIQKYARKAPQATLSGIMEHLYENSIRKLKKSQIRILKQLHKEVANLPASTQLKFARFLEKHNNRILGKPYIEHFHGKSFKYKVNKIAQSFSNKEDLKNYLLRLVAHFDNPIFKNDEAILPEEIAKSISSRFSGKPVTVKEVKLYVINRLGRIGQRFDRKDIVELCKNSEKMVNGEPVIVPFTNKELMHDLAEHVLADHKKTDIYLRMINIAKKLPTSTSNIDSFIVKWRNANSDTIGLKLLEPSSTTIEHIKPTSEGGLDVLSNWSLACKEDNNKRMSNPQYRFLMKFPSRNPQAYFNDLIEITNNEGTFTANEIREMAQTVKNEGRIDINLSRLKEQK